MIDMGRVWVYLYTHGFVFGGTHTHTSFLIHIATGPNRGSDRFGWPFCSAGSATRREAEGVFRKAPSEPCLAPMELPSRSCGGESRTNPDHPCMEYIGICIRYVQYHRE